MIKDVIKARAWNWRADNNRISNSITKHINEFLLFFYISF